MLRKAIVCHADILGWSDRSLNAISDRRGEEFIREAYSAINSAHRWVRQEEMKKIFGPLPPSYQVRTFTDNLVISEELQAPDYDAGEPELGWILWVMRMYQALLTSKGFPVRGGIAAGLHYMDNDFAFGDALVKAVQMEKAGGPPRIVLASSVMEWLKRQVGFYTGSIEETPHYWNLLQDNDDRLFLDYLSLAFNDWPNESIWYQLLADHKRVVEESLKETLTATRVHEKYRWMAGYHNFVCNRFVELTKGTNHEEESSGVSDFLIENVGFPEPQILPQSLKETELLQK